MVLGIPHFKKPWHLLLQFDPFSFQSYFGCPCEIAHHLRVQILIAAGSKARLITMFDDKIHHFSWFLGTSFPPFPHRIFFQTNAFFGAVGSARRLLTWD
jgi:hypothetical protein